MLCYCYGTVSDQLGSSAFNKFDLIWFEDINRSIGLRSTINKLSKLWRANNVSNTMKVKWYDTLVINTSSVIRLRMLLSEKRRQMESSYSRNDLVEDDEETSAGGKKSQDEEWSWVELSPTTGEDISWKHAEEKNDTVRTRDMPGNRMDTRESVELSRYRRKKKPKTTA